jgi:hypothetical protein
MNRAKAQTADILLTASQFERVKIIEIKNNRRHHFIEESCYEEIYASCSRLFRDGHVSAGMRQPSNCEYYARFQREKGFAICD